MTTATPASLAPPAATPLHPHPGVNVRSDGKQNFVHFKQISIPNAQRNSNINQIAVRINLRQDKLIKLNNK